MEAVLCWALFSFWEEKGVGILHTVQLVREPLILWDLGSPPRTSGSPDLIFTAFSLNKLQSTVIAVSEGKS